MADPDRDHDVIDDLKTDVPERYQRFADMGFRSLLGVRPAANTRATLATTHLAGLRRVKSKDRRSRGQQQSQEKYYRNVLTRTGTAHLTR